VLVTAFAASSYHGSSSASGLVYFSVLTTGFLAGNTTGSNGFCLGLLKLLNNF